jgi:hypothetical protein
MSSFLMGDHQGPSRTLSFRFMDRETEKGRGPRGESRVQEVEAEVGVMELLVFRKIPPDCLR